MRRLLLVLLALAPGLFGYVRLNTCQVNSTPPVPCPGIPIVRIDNTGIQFYLNSLVVPGLTASGVTVIAASANPPQAVALAQATWNQVTTANVKFLPVQSTTLFANPNDYTNVISVASSTNDLSALNGAVAITIDSWVTSSGQLPNGTNVKNGDIVDSDILLNPADSFSSDGSTSVDLQAVLTHEFGHTLSANHTGLLGATMFEYTAINQRFLSMDDLAFVNAAYPAAGSAAAPLGTISGTVMVGGAPVPYALLTMTDTNQGITISGVANPDGTYSAQAPPGSYVIYAEPFNTIVRPANLYFTAAQTTLATSVSFVSTFFGGNTAPTTVPVVANGTATANIAVTALPAGQLPLAVPYIGFGKAGGSGDIKIVNQISGPVQVASGQSLDLAFVGPGFDSTLTLANVLILGPGIKATHIGVDPEETINLGGTGLPVVRLTVTITAWQNSGVATIFISKGSTALSTLSLSGVLVITPPTPVFIPASLVSAASYLGSGPGQGAVSPGGIYSIYAPTGSPLYLGPTGGANNVGYSSCYFANCYLSAELGGVSVTFDGIAAPLFYVSGGLINLQVPFEIAGQKSTNIVVNYYGSANTAVAVPVLTEQPAFFTITPEGADSIVINPDGVTINSKTNPAARSTASASTFATVYGTGAGNVAGLVAGQGAAFENALTANYTCTIGSITEPAAFVGWTPTAVGLAQFTFQVPAGIAANSTQPLRCTDTATGVTTLPGTLYVGN